MPYDQFPSTDNGWDQLRELADILDDGGITWWVSSGTLLDLVRDRTLALDTDIDIECRADSRGWNDLVERFREAGYRVRPHPFRGMLYKLWMTHERWRRPVDIDLLRHHGDIMWYPIKAAPFEMLPFRVIRRLWRSTSFLDSRVGLGLLRLGGFRVDSVQIPAEALLPPVRRDFGEVTVSVPRRAEEVLRLHYEDWTVRQDDWRFSRDDGTYVRSIPDADPTPPYISGGRG